MSKDDLIADSRECGSDVAAYALGALDATEVDAFHRHLESCAVCRDELAAFQEVVATLPMTAPAHPVPGDLRRRVMRAVEAEPKRQAERSPAPRRRISVAGWLVPRPALALGTALALAIAVFAGLQLNSSSSPATRLIHAQVTGRGTADVKLTGGHGELVLHRFSPPPAGQIYEVWLKRPNGQPIPTSALFSVTAKGDGDVDVPGSLHGVTQMMVTVEPAGGSRVPTHSPVIQANLD
jgi:anti-sigma-K factor RskA